MVIRSPFVSNSRSLQGSSRVSMDFRGHYSPCIYGFQVSKILLVSPYFFNALQDAYPFRFPTPFLFTVERSLPIVDFLHCHTGSCEDCRLWTWNSNAFTHTKQYNNKHIRIHPNSRTRHIMTNAKCFPVSVAKTWNKISGFLGSTQVFTTRKKNNKKKPNKKDRFLSSLLSCYWAQKK